MLVGVLGFAALVVVALGQSDLRLLTGLRAQRAAEAAAEAGGAVVADRMVELRGVEAQPGAKSDLIDLALADPALSFRAERSAREVLALLRAELVRLTLERRADELSVRVEVRFEGVSRIARVGVREP